MGSGWGIAHPTGAMRDKSFSLYCKLENEDFLHVTLINHCPLFRVSCEVS